MRKTKIMATIGSALKTPSKIAEAISAGVDVFRQSASHQTLEERLKVVENIRKAEKIARKKVGILVDMPGSRPRIGNIRERELEKDETIVLSDKGEIPVDYFSSIKCARKDDTILISDGLIQLRVMKNSGDKIRCKVISAREPLRSRRNVTIPEKENYSPFRSTDAGELQHYAKQGIDYLALSFVKSGRDIEKFRVVMKKAGIKAEIVAKIESKDALKNLEDIVKASDMVMIARGDLAHVSVSKLPKHQMDIIEACKNNGKKCIVATQVMESMTDSPSPLRAEIIDAASTVYQGADFVMLGAETARGKYPVETVKTLSSILKEAENDVRKNPNRMIG